MNNRIRGVITVILVCFLVSCGPLPRRGNSPTKPGTPENTSQPSPSAPAASSPTTTITDTPGLGNLATEIPAESQTGCAPAEDQAVEEAARVTLGPGEGIPASQAKGEPLRIEGTVFAKDCSPLAGAMLRVWQTDPAGEYGPGHGSDQMACCYYLGSVTTGANGRYELITVMPGHYAGEASPPPAHIHVEVVYQGRTLPGTEIVFAGDPALPPNARELDGYTVADLKEASGVLAGTADFLVPVEGQAGAEPAALGKSRRFAIAGGENRAAYTITEKFADIASLTIATGTTGLVEGTILIDLGSWPMGQVVSMTVDLRGLESDDESRDEKLFDRWLETNRFPYARFESSGIENAPSPYEPGSDTAFRLPGELTIHGVTRTVVLDAVARLEGKTLTGRAETVIQMSDFEVEAPNLFGFVRVDDEVKITVWIMAYEAE